jgi:hypothetical protein
VAGLNNNKKGHSRLLMNFEKTFYVIEMLSREWPSVKKKKIKTNQEACRSLAE